MYVADSTERHLCFFVFAISLAAPSSGHSFTFNNSVAPSKSRFFWCLQCLVKLICVNGVFAGERCHWLERWDLRLLICQGQETPRFRNLERLSPVTGCCWNSGDHALLWSQYHRRLSLPPPPPLLPRSAGCSVARCVAPAIPCSSEAFGCCRVARSSHGAVGVPAAVQQLDTLRGLLLAAAAARDAAYHSPPGKTRCFPYLLKWLPNAHRLELLRLRWQRKWSLPVWHQHL